MKWNKKGHQFDELGNHFAGKKILIYGAGKIGKLFYDYLEQIKLFDSVKGFVDHNCKFCEEYKNLPVYDLKEVFPKNTEVIIIVCIEDCCIRQKVIDRLMRAGYVVNYDFFVPEDFELRLNDIVVPIYALYAANKLLVSSTCYIPSTVCNLNCKACLNFTPHISKHTIIPYDKACEDIDILFSSFDYTDRFQISGGEPLIYPKLSELIEYIGVKYRQKIGIYETVLNGTVVPSIEVCEKAKKYNMTFILDNYVENIPSSMNKRNEIIAQINKFGVKMEDNSVEEWFDLGVNKEKISEKSEQELQEFFDMCNNPWHCYDNGYFYTCNFARFAEKAGIADSTENNSFSIKDLQEDKKRELLEFLLNYNEKGYIDFCKRCDGWADINPNRIPVAVQCEKHQNIVEND